MILQKHIMNLLYGNFYKLKNINKFRYILITIMFKSSRRHTPLFTIIPTPVPVITVIRKSFNNISIIYKLYMQALRIYACIKFINDYMYAARVCSYPCAIALTIGDPCP